MKALFFKSALLIASVAFLVGCQKDVSGLSSDNALESKSAISKQAPQEHMLKGRYDAYWDTTVVIPSNNAYGSGEGHLNMLGKSMIYYNTISTWPSLDLFYNAPVTQYFGEELTLAGFPSLPSNVSAIMLDKQRNAIFLSLKVGKPGKYTFHEEYPNLVTPVDIKGTYTITGGTGKFTGAAGEVELTGYWDPNLPHETLLVIEGEIVF